MVLEEEALPKRDPTLVDTTMADAADAARTLPATSGPSFKHSVAPQAGGRLTHDTTLTLKNGRASLKARTPRRPRGLHPPVVYLIYISGLPTDVWPQIVATIAGELGLGASVPEGKAPALNTWCTAMPCTFH